MSANEKSKKLILHTIEKRTKVMEYLRYGTILPVFMPVDHIEGNLIYTWENSEHWADCREIAIGNIRAILAHKKKREGKDFQGFNKLHYLMGFSTQKKEASKRCSTVGLRIVRAFDRILKCKPTHIKQVELISNSSDGTVPITNGVVSLIEADKDWSKAPELISLHMLLLRLGRFNDFKSLLQIPLERIPKELIKLAGKPHGNSDEDLIRIHLYTNTWVEALKDYEEIFRRKKFSTAFKLGSDEASTGMMYTIGIDDFCEKKTGVSVDSISDGEDDDRYDYDDEYDEDDD